MSTPDSRAVGAPTVRPADARFSSGPCRKHPGWSLDDLSTDHLGHSHRAAAPKARLASAISRQSALLGLPADWVAGIVPGSDTGAFEMALWSLIGSRPVDVLKFEAFSGDWAKDLAELGVDARVHEAPYGELPDLTALDPSHDLVTVFNGTTSGVRLPSLDFVPVERDALVLCDATSAAFAMSIDFSRVDVLTWSWQKALGGEAAHGMLALSPRAVQRLESEAPPRPLPKLFRLLKGGKLNAGIFKGATINTPSMLAVEDLHSALDWAERIGGLAALQARSQASFDALDSWVQANPNIDWLAVDPACRSTTSMCLKIVHTAFVELPAERQQAHVDAICKRLADQGVAYDIGNYRSAPPGFRVWGGATVEPADVAALTAWLDYELQAELADIERAGVTA